MVTGKCAVDEVGWRQREYIHTIPLHESEAKCEQLCERAALLAAVLLVFSIFGHGAVQAVGGRKLGRVDEWELITRGYLCLYGGRSRDLAAGHGFHLAAVVVLLMAMIKALWSIHQAYAFGCGRRRTRRWLELYAVHVVELIELIKAVRWVGG
jgi:hypothetical protein